jgi:uncharacterized protein (DUF1015 family)
VYDPAVAGPLDRLTAPPYDVISDSRRRSYLDGSAHNIVHLDLAEGNDDPEAPDSRYAGAAELLRTWIDKGVLRRTIPSYFAYEVRYRALGDDRSVRGVFCALELEPWGGMVLPHEEVMGGPVQDRLSLLRATRTHLSAIYGTIPGPVRALADHLDETCRRPSTFEVLDGEGVRHRMWELTATTPVNEWLADQPMLIADGHHRYTTALAYRDERHAAEGPGPWDRILTLIVDAGAQDVRVLPYHRVQLAGTPPGEGSRVATLAAALEALDDDVGRYATVTRRADGRVDYRLHAVEGRPPTVRALHDERLDRDAPGDAVRFTHDAGDADEMVRTGQAVAAYLLPPTHPDRILAAIRRGERLPRKSTFFWPKPRTGMVLMPLGDPVIPPAAPPAS